jgi:hypothetical protein
MGLTGTTRDSRPANRSVGDAWELFLSALRRSRRGVLAVNQHGLLPNQPYAAIRPQLAIVSQLRQLHLSGAMRLIVFTDRQWSKVANCLGCTPPPEIWGVGGLERAKPDAPYQGPTVAAEHQQALARAFELAGEYGLQPWVEMKPGGVGLYLNGFTAADTRALGTRLWRPWSRIASCAGLEIVEMRHGVELRVPGRRRQKAVQEILSELKPKTPIAYVGTDVLDEPVMHTLRGRGLTALFGSEARMKADIAFSGWSQFSEFLEAWQAATQGASFPLRETSGDTSRFTRKEPWDEQAQGSDYSRRSGPAGRTGRVCPKVSAAQPSALV